MEDVKPRWPENNDQVPDESDAKPLCLSCLVPNELSAHFCAKCGAPLTSYAATGPFEHLFAEGHVYRQATERPRSFIVVFGIWLIFGTMALTAAALVFMSRENGVVSAAFGAFLLPVSLIIIWKTTRNYLARPRMDNTPD
ncbi:MAG: hypothetical protein H0X66_11640 [Verrucomicrobia bacterium]|nr:hypothetical protein [Verrucomicrobiota bacterium]